MNSRDRASLLSTSTDSSANSNSRRTLPARRTMASTSAKSQTSKPVSSSPSSAPTKKVSEKAYPSSTTDFSRKTAKPVKNNHVLNTNQPESRTILTQDHIPAVSKTVSKAPHRTKFVARNPAKDTSEESSGSSQEMTVTSLQGDQSPTLRHEPGNSSEVHEQETNIDHSTDSQATDDDESATLLESCPSERKPALSSRVTSDELSVGQVTTRNQLPAGWEEHTDKDGIYFWHVPTGVIQRTRPSNDSLKVTSEQTVLYHDDEEINQTSTALRPSRTSSEEDDYTLESGAALTLADDSTVSDAISFVVYPLGCCEFDETQLISANSTRAIQKCILRLSNTANKDECICWGLDQSQPILMRLLDDHIQFTDISTQTLLRSQPIQTIKTWAVDDDNNFAFVVEDHSQVGEAQLDSVDYALLTGPTFMCYVFSSMDDDDMSLKVATKLNKEINRYRVQMSDRMSKCTRLQQMVDSKPLKTAIAASTMCQTAIDNDMTDADEDLEDVKPDDDDDLAESSEVSLSARYIGKVQVPRPMGIDVLNVAIDKCLADASKAQMDRLLSRNASTSNAPSVIDFDGHLEIASPLMEAKIHVSPSSVIVENEQTGEIIVECRIRYLTFMGISRRDIRWCGFIMQNTTNQTFVAHCFECHPTAGHVCEAIQASCSRMYEKMVKRQNMKQQVDDATSIMPKSSKIRDTLAKTLSKIKLTPII